MIINFLQTRSPKILPALQQPPYHEPSKSTSSFCDDLDSVKSFGEDNTESLGALLFGFFRRYGHEINYEREVVSVREGQLISKQLKKWHLLQNNRLGVEEPFNTERNLGNTADDTSFRGVHLELRRAFDLIAKGKLDECCEQYEFPAHEEKVWTRPTPQPRPILTRSQSQTGRSLKGGSNSSKGSNSGQRHRNGTPSRRASSAAAMNKVPPVYPAMANGDRSISSNQIHDHLIHHFQILQQQEQQLRLQMHQRVQANLHAQVTAQVHHQPLQVQTVPYAQQANPDNRRHSSLEPSPLSAPLRTMQAAYYYPVQMMNQSPVQSLSPSLPTSQNTTSPSSPSQAVAQIVSSELRRSGQRSSTTDSNGVLRSHSQPPATMKVQPQNGRPVVMNQYSPAPQGHLQGYSTLQQYQQAFLQTRRSEPYQATPESSETSSQAALFYDPSMQERPLREYMGYYVDQNAPSRSRDRSSLTPQSSAYNDLAHRARTVSPNLSRLRRSTSRSPSPSQSSASVGRAINFYSSDSPPFQQYSRGMMGDGQTQSSGPVIVDGSSDTSEYVTPSELSYYPPANSGPASTNSDERPINTPTSGSVATPIQDKTDPFQFDSPAEPQPATYVPSFLQFGEFPARATLRPQQVQSDDGPRPEKATPVPSIRKEVLPGQSMNGLGIEVDPSKSQDNPLVNGLPAQKTMHHSSTLSGLNLASSLKPLVTLSPVREVRTPSPTTMRNQIPPGENRNVDLHGRSFSLTKTKEPGPSPLGTTSNTSMDTKSKDQASSSKNESSKLLDNKTKDAQPLPNGVPSKSTAKAPPNREQQQSQVKVIQPIQTSGWHQSTNKKKNKKKSASVGSAVIPIEPNERKGG